MEIHPTDVVSGAMYLKLLNGYKDYDRKQKEIIQEQQKRIEFLEWQVEDLRAEIEESEIKSHEKLLTKLHNQRVGLKAYMEVISKLRKDVETLTCRNVQLTMELQRLKEGV
ncbi:hypothetical protein [uncultured Duncaniella sp.]|uniref:hypothetical protein n=1 Tax=uncultured Duncaniella sp. TaxID=2768039 RepID=UPI0025B6D9F1|nr:hypothetical protein [uncultured Duncaniella sp.]